MRKPDGLVINTLEKSVLRYALFHSSGRPVIKLIPSPSVLKLTDLFEVCNLLPNSKAYLCADQELSKLIKKKLPQKCFVPIKKADYVLDLTCMNTKLSRIFGVQQKRDPVRLAANNKLPLFVCTPIQSLHTVDAIICRAYEATMLEYPGVTVARIP